MTPEEDVSCQTEWARLRDTIEEMSREVSQGSDCGVVSLYPSGQVHAGRVVPCVSALRSMGPALQSDAQRSVSKTEMQNSQNASVVKQCREVSQKNYSEGF